MKKIIFTVIALSVIQFTFSQERLQRRGNPEQLFEKLDANGDDILSFEEFSAFKSRRQRPIGNQARDPQEIFDRIDENGNGLITKEEFLSARSRSKGKMKSKISEEDKAKMKLKMKGLKDKVKEADKDGDYRISFSEFTTIDFDQDIDYKELFDRLDANGNGFIEKGEMKNNSKRKAKGELKNH